MELPEPVNIKEWLKKRIELDKKSLKQIEEGLKNLSAKSHLEYWEYVEEQMKKRLKENKELLDRLNKGLVLRDSH